jgi:5,10-methylenetetrahydromethanopterin reductase
LTRFSVAFEGNRPLAAYPKLAQKAEEYGFHSFQIYEHLPFKPAWPIAFLAGRATKRILVGPVTVPVFLHRPLTLARNLNALSELTHGRAMLGISRGAYAETIREPVNRSIHAVIKTVTTLEKLIEGDSERSKPFLLIGTSGPRLASVASRLKIVRGIIVDNLWNPDYAAKLRGIIDEAQQNSPRRERVLLISRPFTMLSETKKKGIRKLSPILKSYLHNLVGDSPMLDAAGFTYSKLLNIVDEKAALPEALIENFAACGAPRDIELKVEEMFDAGVDHICFGHPLDSDNLASMNLLSKTILANFN